MLAHARNSNRVWSIFGSTSLFRFKLLEHVLKLGNFGSLFECFLFVLEIHAELHPCFLFVQIVRHAEKKYLANSLAKFAYGTYVARHAEKKRSAGRFQINSTTPYTSE